MFRRRTLATASVGLGLGALARRAAPETATRSGESSLDRVRRTGVLRVTALPGEPPFFVKDLATGEWNGAAIDMAKSIASELNVKLGFVEGTYASSVLDLEANKSDLAFALNPTPQRALAIGFTIPYYLHPFGYVARPGFNAKTWGDLNDPKIRVASLIGSLTDNLLARYAPNAQSIGVKTGSDAIMSMQSGRADCIIYGLIQALGVTARAPDLGQVTVLNGPHVALASAMGIQEEQDRRWRDFLNAWTEYNVGTRQVGAWIRDALVKMGVKPGTIPADADL